MTKESKCEYENGKTYLIRKDLVLAKISKAAPSQFRAKCERCAATQPIDISYSYTFLSRLECHLCLLLLGQPQSSLFQHERQDDQTTQTPFSQQTLDH